MRKIFTLSFCMFIIMQVYGQTETHNFTTYDTTFNGQFGSWQIRITRPVNMFVAGSPDTASRPAIITQPGIGEAGNADQGNLTKYGPHYWLLNGWDGSVVLGNGTHYPILITVAFINNPWPSPEGGAEILSFLLSHYHIKRNSVHLGGLSEGSFVWTSMIAFEQTAGAETGMSMVTSLTALEGFALQQDAPYSSWERGDEAYKIWAAKYHGKYFGLEGVADYRNVGEGAVDVNDTVPGAAFFSYETLGGGSHCCWNSMYDPSATNWTSVGTLGPNNAKGASPNSMGTYRTPENVFQWMLRQGDTSLVGGTAATPVPVANAGTDQTITLPSNSVALSGSGTESGGSISSYAWTWFSGPAQYTFSSTTVANPTVSNLTTGTYVFKLTVTDANGATASDTVSVLVKAAAGSPTDLGSNTFPGTVQAEDYTNMSGVATQTTSDSGGGLNVGWIDMGDWMAYSVNVATAGTYTVSFRVAASANNASFNVENASGAVLATVAVPNTGGFQNWTTVNATMTLPAGTQTINIVSTNATEWNINWFSAVLGTGTGAQQVIPGIIQGESYTSMSGVATQATTDVGGGLNVGYIDDGDWMSYAVNVQTAGVYTVSFRLAAVNGGGTFQVDNGASTVYAQVSVPSTGAYQTWTTVSATVTLSAGIQTIRLLSTAAINWNINWMSFTVASPGVYPIPGVVQAENYASMSGVIPQATTDVGGGLNVGYIDLADWMSYSVNAAAAGAYTVSFRVAAAGGGTFNMLNGSGAVLATVAVPNTGGYQVWTTVKANVTLPAGQQTIKLLSTSASDWNINWMEFDAGTTTTTQTGGDAISGQSLSSFAEDSSAVEAKALSLFPNPTADAVMITMSNTHTGKLMVQVISTTGRLVKTYAFEKGLPEMQVQISLAGLPAGIYLVRVGGDDWQQIRKVIKL